MRTTLAAALALSLASTATTNAVPPLGITPAPLIRALNQPCFWCRWNLSWDLENCSSDIFTEEAIQCRHDAIECYRQCRADNGCSDWSTHAIEDAVLELIESGDMDFTEAAAILRWNQP